MLGLHKPRTRSRLHRRICPHRRCPQNWKVTAVIDLEPDRAHHHNPDPPALEPGGSKLSKFGKKARSQSTPITGTPKRKVPKKHFTFPARPAPVVAGRDVRDTDEPTVPPGVGEKRTRKNATLSRGWSKIRTVVQVLRVFLRLKKLSKTDKPPAQ